MKNIAGLLQVILNRIHFNIVIEFEKKTTHLQHDYSYIVKKKKHSEIILRWIYYFLYKTEEIKLQIYLPMFKDAFEGPVKATKAKYGAQSSRT